MSRLDTELFTGVFDSRITLDCATATNGMHSPPKPDEVAGRQSHRTTELSVLDLSRNISAISSHPNSPAELLTVSHNGKGLSACKQDDQRWTNDWKSNKSPTNNVHLDEKSLLGDADSVWELVDEVFDGLTMSEGKQISAIADVELGGLPPFRMMASGAPVDADDKSGTEHDMPWSSCLPPKTPACMMKDSQATPPRSNLSNLPKMAPMNPYYSPPVTRSSQLPSGANTVYKATDHGHRVTPPTKKQKQQSQSEPIKKTRRTRKPNKPRSPPLVVGPDSEQMKMIERIMVYLEESKTEQQNVLDSFYHCKKECEIRHARREMRYLHLPGAIFEMFVEHIGGAAFLRIYKKSQTFDHPRQQQAAAFPSTANKAVPPPNLLHIAVGYGMHLTQQQQLDSADKGMEEMVKDGASAVLKMREEDRQVFWNHLLNWKTSPAS